jgi:hypothetical protein
MYHNTHPLPGCWHHAKQKFNRKGVQKVENVYVVLTAPVITAHIHFKSTNWGKIPVSAAIKLIGF